MEVKARPKKRKIKKNINTQFVNCSKNPKKHGTREISYSVGYIRDRYGA